MKLPTEYVLHVDGHIQSLDEIVRNTSFDLYQTALHYEICHYLALRRSADPIVRKVLENLYALKSSAARKATALVAYLQRTKVPVQSLCISPSVRDMLPINYVEEVCFKQWEGPVEPLIGWDHVRLLLVKALIHRLFRLLTWRIEAASTFVRAWVDVTASIYPREVRHSAVLVYPFALNIVRQIRFIRWCRREGISASLCGLPYSPLRILAGLLRRLPNDLLLAQAEVRANSLHGQELLESKPCQLLTSDEFETASFVLYRPLIEAGIEVINTAHGVGNYCPHIGYTEFRVLTPSQGAFYAERNPAIRYTILPTEFHKIEELPHYMNAAGKPVALVLIHQSFELSSLKAEEAVQVRIDKELARVARVFGVQYYIKMHPNSRNGLASRFFHGEAIYDWTKLKVFRPIFVTINSTVFFDARGVAPVLVYSGPTFEPSLYFPLSVSTFTLENVESVLSSLLPDDAWLRAAACHAMDQNTNSSTESYAGLGS